MTTVAWDGVRLAADRQRRAAYRLIPARKVHKLVRGGKELLVAGAGDSFYIEGVLNWMRGGEQPNLEKPEDGCTLMAVDQQFRVWVTDWRMVWVQHDVRQWAIGSGGDYAMAAMYCGKNAVEAIDIASELDSDTGLGVDYVHF